jgi:glycerol-3-phosphate dehydrogenase
MTSAALSRAQRLEALGDRPFDLLVIGGGITGCGIARDAALRGLRVALVEKDDFASGTSSRSSRLVHGGVRYLEHGHLRLVFESSAERRRLLRLAPHLVRPLEFTWPVYTGARIPRWKLGAALTLYDTLALFRNVHRHHRLSRAAVLEHEPALRADGLLGGAGYYDAATNDARLTLANAVAALEAGATVMNHVAAEGFVTEKGRAVGATVQDALSERRIAVRASVVVSAIGPWTQKVRGSKGAHIAVPRDRIGNRHAITLLSPRDGRVLFALPAGPHAIMGTTDTYTTSSPDSVRASNDDVRYLIDAANAFFPRAALSAADVVSAWAGIRPLIANAGDSPGAATREHAIVTSADGVISITGGKLTTYRVMARDVVDAVVARLRRGESDARAKTTPLPGGDFSSLDDLIAEAARATNDVALADHLTMSYGARWRSVWGDVDRPDGRAPLHDGLPYTIGELRYAARHEMAETLGDLLIRRTHVAFETRDHGISAAPRVAAQLAPLFEWDREAQRRAVADYASEVERIFGIDPS